MEEIMQQMLPHLDNAQLQKLEEVLEHSLFMYEISSKCTETEDDSQKLIDAFVYAKRIEGCSEKTLKYYRTTIEKMTEAIDKGDFIIAGIDEKSLLQAVDTAVELCKDDQHGIPVPDYVDENVSTKVVKIVQSYVGIVNKMVWRKL